MDQRGCVLFCLCCTAIDQGFLCAWEEAPGFGAGDGRVWTWGPYHLPPQAFPAHPNSTWPTEAIEPLNQGCCSLRPNPTCEKYPVQPGLFLLASQSFEDMPSLLFSSTVPAIGPSGPCTHLQDLEKLQHSYWSICAGNLSGI